MAVQTRAVFFDVDFTLIHPGPSFEGRGGRGPGVELAAREIYDQWAACHHFEMYPEVPEVLRSIRATGVRIGLISNTQRCLSTFAEHFELVGLFDVSLSSYQHGFMKPHPSIFEAALRAVDSRADAAVMVGDSLAHDIEGAIAIGMRGVLLARAGRQAGTPADLPVIQSLRELPEHL